MAQMNRENPKISFQDIEHFEQKFNITLPKDYAEFLLNSNGGYPKDSAFKTNNSDGEGVVNKFYGIGDMKSNLGRVFEVLEGEIPEEFISIANDPGN